jgi:hypothetical protein
MPIDANILLQGRSPQINDPIESYGNALKVKGMMQQNALYDRGVLNEQKLAQALQDPGARNQDGSINYLKLKMDGLSPDQQFDLSDRGVKQQRDAAAASQASEKARLEMARDHLAFAGQVMGPVQDQNGYTQALHQLKSYGVDISQMPAQYDPVYVKVNLSRALNAKDQLDQHWKRLDYDLDVRRQGEVERNNRVQNDISQGNLGLSRQRQQGEQGQIVETANGPVLVNRRTGKVLPVSVNGQQLKPVKKSAGGISPTLQKELIQTDEEVQAGTAALGLIAKAKAASKEAYSGLGAGTRAVVASNLGVGGAGADATVELNNLVTSQALETLKATFGGAPTEGERKILLDIQAAPDKTPAQRKAILDRAQAAVERRVRLAKGKSKAIRSGQYLTEDYDPGADMQAPTNTGGFKFLGFE